MTETPGSDIGGALTRESAKRPAHRRRLRWLWPVLVIVVLAVAAGAFLAVEDSRTVALGEISPASGALLNTRPVIVSCGLFRFVPGRGTVSLSVDGQPVQAGDVTLQPGMVQARLALAEGEHTIGLEYDSSNVFSRHLARTWNVSVDTTAPGVSVASPASFPLLRAKSTDIGLDLTEAATVTLTLDGAALSPVPAESSGGALKATIVAGEGEHVLALKASDDAGNVTNKQWDIVVDYKAPEVTAEGLSDAEVWNKDNSAAVTLTVADRFPDKLEVSATLDGGALTLDERKAGPEGERAFAFDTGALAEGTHQIDISATDLAGHVTTLKRSFLVDTSSTFGARTLKSGAMGSDVQQLQRILAIKGVYTGTPDGTYGESTAAAVEAFNQKNGLDGGAVVTEETLKYLLGAIRIDLSERKLYLYSGDGALVKTYGVAVGMPKYPTPTGGFRIITKQRNPTWNPPDSAWAAGMGPVPPGPGNPLGTRWMGLNSPGIGIHGTPTPSSIGTAASHGCIRMRIPDAEDLFDRVFVGTPVEIVK
jgi:lipoprotein-anchoring transpeptidase ErfK/SrfK